MENHSLGLGETLEISGKEIIGNCITKTFNSDKAYKVKKYDFRRPDKFSKDQIKTVQMIHETFARLVTTRISALLRTLVEVHVHSVDQMNFDEFIQSIPNPTSIGVLNMDPLPGSTILEIDPNIIFSFIDRLFGGNGNIAKTTREMTDIELSVIEGMYVHGFLGCLKESWSNLIGLNPRLATIETNPQFAQIVPPNNMVILVSFSFKIGSEEGLINFCIPYITIESLMPKLSAQYWYSLMRGDVPTNSTIVAGLKFDADIHFKTSNISLKEIWDLKKGDMIKLSEYGSGRAVLSANNNVEIPLEFKSNGEWQFNVLDTMIKTDDIEQILSQSNTFEKSAAETQNVFSKSIEKLSEYIRNQVQGIEKKVEQLSAKQEEFTNQIGLAATSGQDAMTSPKTHKKPFDFVRTVDPAFLFNFIVCEYPQTIAMIVVYLESQNAATILKWLPPELQIDVTRRMAVMDRTSPDILHEVERVLERKLTTLKSEDFTSAGGINAVVEVLNLTDRGTERNIIMGLEKSNPELAENIKQNMFVFEDIPMIENKYIKKIFENSSRQDILLSLKAVPENVRDFVMKNLPEQFKKGFKEEFDALGRVRLNEVEAAQQKIVNVIRVLEGNGEIVVARSDEKLV